MPADYSRINRLLQIYLLIQGGPGWTVKTLAAECKTTERSIFRDIRVLRDVGVPLFHDTEKKCYQIHRDYFLRSVDLTFDESLALLVLGKSIHDHDQIPFSRAALRAMAKIRGQLPAPVQREVETIDEHLTVKLGPSATQEGFEDCYDKVRRAISTRTCLRCQYESVGKDSGKEPAFFLLKPYTLFFSQRAWYVVGYHGGRDAVRTLKLNRFAAMEATKQAYSMPKGFSLAKHLGNAWRMIRGSKTYHVDLRFDAEFAETIADTAWHPTQSFENEPDGSLRFSCTVDGLDEIVWWVLSMGAHCQVLGPEELIDRVREESVKMQAMYAPTGTRAR